MTIFTRKIGRRGNGLWIRIRAAIVRQMNLKVRGEAEVVRVGDHGFELRCVSGSERTAGGYARSRAEKTRKIVSSPRYLTKEGPCESS